MAIAKLLLLPVCLVAHQYAATPPNGRPPDEQLREQHGIERVVPLTFTLTKTILWTWVFLEGSVLFALSGHCPPGLVQPLLHFLPALPPSNLSTLTAVTPAFLAGTVLAVVGALLRVHCFRTLGRYFTFELSIRHEHELITDGVYDVVRHPSYTAVLGLAVGLLLCVLDRQGLVVSVFSGMFGTKSRGTDDDAMVTPVLVCVWVTALGMLFFGLNARMDNEDAMLKKAFGKEWLAWAKRVPYRLVPGVY